MSILTKVFNELISIEKEIKNDDDDLICYHYIIKYDELSHRLFINIFDDINKCSEWCTTFKDVTVSEFVEMVIILYNNYYSNMNYSKYKDIFKKVTISNNNVIIS